MYEQENGLVFKINTDDSTAYLVKSRKAKGNVFIPTSIYHDTHKYIITKISTNSFQNNNQIKSIDFSHNSELHTIENDAFNGSSLESISLPSSIKELQDGWCRCTSKLKKIIISEDNKKFKYLDSEHNIVISNEENENEYESIIFASRDILEAKIPSFIKYIKSYSFHECEQLKKIEFSEDSKLEIIEKDSFSYSSLKSIQIPLSVIKIGEKAFSWCQSLVKVEIPKNSNLVSIGNGTFSKSYITSISIPSHLKQIGEGAFSWCQRLRSIEFPDDSELHSIGNCAFYGSLLESISIPSQVDDLKDGWCRYTPFLTHVSISPNNKRFLCYKENMIIGKSDIKSDIFDILFFVYRNADSALVPKFIKQIGSYAFSGCQSLKKIEFEEESALVSIGKGTFSNSIIDEISIPKHVKMIGEEAFSRCYKLKKIEFIENSELHSIEKFAFEDSSIESISIPASVEDLQEGWCRGTPKLNNIIISSSNEHFKYLDSNHTIIIGKSKSNENGEYENIIFANRTIKEAKIPSFIKHIKSYSFYQCNHLKTINFSDDSTLETIGKESFSYSSISHIKIPSNVNIISDSSFSSCQKLKKVEFYKNSKLKRIGKDAFSNSSLEKIQIPIEIKNIEEGSFSFCKNLNTVEFEGGTKLRKIDKRSFCYSSIKSIIVPFNVNKIGESAFFSCTDLYCIEILNDHILIEGFCFKDCTNLSIASFPNARRVAYVGGEFSESSEKFSLFINPHAIIISTIE